MPEITTSVVRFTLRVVQAAGYHIQTPLSDRVSRTRIKVELCSISHK